MVKSYISISTNINHGSRKSPYWGYTYRLPVIGAGDRCVRHKLSP